MYKLVILIESTLDPTFDENWPHFLRVSEHIPGLQREATCRVERVLFGSLECGMIHELYFDTLEALQGGMLSPQGQEAGRLLQVMTGGRMTLLFADHKEDALENIRRYQYAQGDGKKSPDTL